MNNVFRPIMPAFFLREVIADSQCTSTLAQTRFPIPTREKKERTIENPR
jgi:hypothetical protein